MEKSILHANVTPLEQESNWFSWLGIIVQVWLFIWIPILNPHTVGTVLFMCCTVYSSVGPIPNPLYHNRQFRCVLCAICRLFQFCSNLKKDWYLWILRINTATPLCFFVARKTTNFFKMKTEFVQRTLPTWDRISSMKSDIKWVMLLERIQFSVKNEQVVDLLAILPFSVSTFL